MSELPTYDPTFPAIAQNDDWSCSCTSTRWALYAWGRRPTEQWLENAMLADGVVSTRNGLEKASGVDLAAWINREYGEYGYVSDNDALVSWDDVAQEVEVQKHPVMIGGRAWVHWTGVRGVEGNRLLLANPASGYQGITQTLNREQFGTLGPFSMVRVLNPAAENGGTTPAPPDPSDPYGPWRGTVGSGLLELMAQDHTLPAQRRSTWLPLGAPAPADVEECLGQNGTMYRWALTVGRGWRYRPD